MVKTEIRRLLAPVAAACVMALASCDGAIYDGEGDCGYTYRVNLRYDMNMKFADAFAAEVRTVNLYAADAVSGSVVWSGEAAVDDSGESFSMELPVKPGDYRLTAWCGAPVDGAAPWVIDTAGLGCALRREGSEVTTDLDRLYHGALDVTLPDLSDTGGEYVCTVPLTKNTNNVRVVLQQMAGQSLDPARFSFAITADNSAYDAANGCVDAGTVTYRAWDVQPAEAEIGTETYAGRADVSYPAVVAELTTGRLVKGRDTRLTVTDTADGSVILSIPLIDYALMVKGNYNEAMDDQEYLDRQDEYTMVFFLDEGSRWIDAYIYINSWMVVLQNTGL